MTMPYNEEMYKRITSKVLGGAEDPHDVSKIIEKEMHNSDEDLAEEFISATTNQRNEMFIDLLTIMSFWYKQSKCLTEMSEDLKVLSQGLVAALDYTLNDVKIAKHAAEKHLSRSLKMASGLKDILRKTDIELSEDKEDISIKEKLEALKDLVEDPKQTERVKEIMEEVREEVFPTKSLKDMMSELGLSNPPSNN